MTLESFVSKYNGKYVDYDGKWGCQCVDLLRQYLKERLGLDPYCLPTVAYAKEIYTKFNPNNKYFVKVANNPTNVPDKGDIVIWGPHPFVTGWAGHVAIFTNGDVNSLITFDQNWGNPSYCRLVRHSYRGVLGWLKRP